MSDPFVPDTRLGEIIQEIGITGTTLPRTILSDLGWPQALIEDYDAKGRDQNRSNEDVVMAAEGALTAQRWSRENQLTINNQQSSINNIQRNIRQLDSLIRTLQVSIETLQTMVSTLQGAVTTLQSQVVSLQPQTGTAEPEGMVESNLNRTYYRIDGMTVEIYFNPSATGNTGWVLVSTG